MKATQFGNLIQGLQKLIGSSTRRVEELASSVATITSQISEILESIQTIRGEIKDIKEEISKNRVKRDKGASEPTV
jgi:archaellum component FlaC